MIPALLAAALAGLSIAGAALAETSSDLLGRLRQGGYVIYMRHGPTDLSQRPIEEGNLAAGRLDLADCSTQRNLSREGRMRLSQAALAFRSLGVPLGKIVASRYCRTMETARLFAGEPEPADDLTPRAGTGEPGCADALLVRLRRAPAPGTNTLIVAHRDTMKAVEGLQPEEGEALVFIPGSETAPHKRLGSIRLGEWKALAASGLPQALPASVP